MGQGEQSDADGAVRATRAPRQGRVGILPNPNRKPMPPPRRPPLIGRFMQLRSSRRPPLVPDPPATPAPDPEAARSADVVRQRDGAIAEIDIDQLNALADSLTAHRPRRRVGIADHIMRDRPPEVAMGAPTPPPDDAPDDPPVVQAAPTAMNRLRGYLARLAGRGG